MFDYKQIPDFIKMPQDTRRLPVPEDSKSPLAFCKSSETNLSLVNKDGDRHDGRKPEQSRPVFLKVGVVSQAKGSAYIEMDKTKVLCAVYGPREVTRREEFSMRGQLNCEFKYATFSNRLRRQHQQDNEEKDLSAMLEEALEPAVCLEKFPKARMDVFVTVLEDDGSVLAAAMTVASVALADAGVEMYDLVVGCSLRQIGNRSLIDPSGAEEFKSKLGEDTENNGSIIIGFMTSIHQMSALSQHGQMELSVAQEGVKELVGMCQRTYPVLRQCLTKAVKHRLKAKHT